MSLSHTATDAAARHRPAGLLALLLLGLLVAGLRLTSNISSPFVIVLDMKTAVSGQGQVFVSGPSGYSEPRSMSFPLTPDGRRHAYRTSFSSGIPDFVRIDPGATAGTSIVHSIRFEYAGASATIDGATLKGAIRPLNRIEVGTVLAEGISLQATGDDPHFELQTPQALRGPAKAMRLIGIALAIASAVGMAVLAYVSRSRLVDWLRATAAGNGWTLPVAVAATIAVLVIVGFGIEFWSVSGIGNGAQLLLAGLCLAVVGAATLDMLGIRRHQTDAAKLFLWMAVGQVTFVVYVFLRSLLFVAAPALPITAVELFVLVAASGLVLFCRGRRGELPSLRTGTGWLLIELGTFTAICWVIADRELPRLLMLSSDPDTHAFLARQIESLGAIPWRGEAKFNYPAGSAALTFVWSGLAGLDVRDALTALPLLQTFVAALMLGEGLASRSENPTTRAATLFTCLAVVSAGFLLPIYAPQSHMEGTGRQMAIAAMAIPIALLMNRRQDEAEGEWPLAVVVLATLFVLAALNPASVVAPGVLVGAYVFYVLVSERRISPVLLALFALPAVLLLDPYYAALLTGTEAGVVKVPMTDAYRIKSLDSILADWLIALEPRQLSRLLLELAGLTPGQTKPVFLALVLAVGVLIMAMVRTRRLRWQAIASVGLVVVVIVAIGSLFLAVRDDRRLFLLQPYFQFSLTQYKTLLIAALCAAAAWVGASRRLPAAVQVAVACGLVLTVAMSVRGTQKLMVEPRRDYCGSLGCIENSDIAVLHRLEALTRNEKEPPDAAPRVLVPNSVHRTDKEYWVFPVAGARATPFFDVIPVAFFYYQGDDDFTTDSYVQHVCEHFDRAWLKHQRIEYVFLPANRASACMDSMERLPLTEDVVAHVGNSYLLRIR